MRLRFTKMHGLGNDYVYVSLFDQTLADAPALARRISDRHRGIGSDGLILVGPPDATARGPNGVAAAVRMTMYNVDGSRGEMCGNGIRCVAKLAWEHGLVAQDKCPRSPAGRPLIYAQTDAGVLPLELFLNPHAHPAAPPTPAPARVDRVRVNMGTPILAPRRIPADFPGERIVRAPLRLDERTLEVTCVSMGNPHAIIFASDVAAVPLADWGPRLEHHPRFPERINVHFAQVLARDRVRMITWERGSGATQACGTGAAAVCVAGVLNELTQRVITAELPGGQLQLDWDTATGHVFMTGPAEEVFTGEIEI